MPTVDVLKEIKEWISTLGFPIAMGNILQNNIAHRLFPLKIKGSEGRASTTFKLLNYFLATVFAAST